MLEKQELIKQKQALQKELERYQKAEANLKALKKLYDDNPHIFKKGEIVWT